MKNNFFEGTGGKILLAINCLLLAIIFWIVVECSIVDELPLFMFS